jgi:hypothetical protein
VSEENEPRRLRGSAFNTWTWQSGWIFFGPIAVFDEFLDLSAFVAVFLSFYRAIIGLAKGMLWVSDDFTKCLYRLAHFGWFLVLFHNGCQTGPWQVV